MHDRKGWATAVVALAQADLGDAHRISLARLRAHAFKAADLLSRRPAVRTERAVGPKLGLDIVASSLKIRASKRMGLAIANSFAGTFGEQFGRRAEAASSKALPAGSSALNELARERLAYRRQLQAQSPLRFRLGQMLRGLSW
jgi:hypothetical protein